MDGWVRRFTDLDSAADGTPGIYWYASNEPDQFPSRFPGFLPALVGAGWRPNFANQRVVPGHVE